MFVRFSFFSSCSISDAFSRIWAIVCPYSPKNLSYRNIFWHCPTAAAACFIRMDFGFSFSPILWLPTAIAPDDTRITSYPRFAISLRISASLSNALRFVFPASFVRVDVPTFTTILFCTKAIV